MGVLDDPWIKWTRADEQSKSLYEKFREAFHDDTDPIKVKIKTKAHPKPPGSTDTRRWGEFIFVVTEAPQYGPEFGVLIGELVHNLRGSLDHLAWILVRRGSLGRRIRGQATQVMFPMARSREDFWKGRRRKGRGRRKPVVERCLPGVSLDQRTLAERYQPYRRSPTGRAIRYLQKLSNTDKHRLIVPVANYPADFTLNVKGEGAKPISIDRRLKPGQQLKKNTEVVSIVFVEMVTRKGKVSMDGPIPFGPGFHRSLLKPVFPKSVLWVEEVIEEAKAVCAEILHEFEVLL